MTRAWPQTLIVSRDVRGSARFYTELLAAESGHGGGDYEQILSDGELVLQIHAIDVEDHHGPLAAQDVPLGNGVLIWFEVADFDAAVERARGMDADVERGVHTNPNALQQEIWLRDPDGYLIVLAGESEYRPRSS
ncbi:MAG TPA: VOC family protein [Gaiellaceae bacterium]|nr:VOC family protein [Gaiellaceae bacterium]